MHINHTVCIQFYSAEPCEIKCHQLGFMRDLKNKSRHTLALKYWPSLPVSILKFPFHLNIRRIWVTFEMYPICHPTMNKWIVEVAFRREIPCVLAQTKQMRILATISFWPDTSHTGLGGLHFSTPSLTTSAKNMYKNTYKQTQMKSVTIIIPLVTPNLAI